MKTSKNLAPDGIMGVSGFTIVPNGSTCLVTDLFQMKIEEGQDYLLEITSLELLLRSMDIATRINLGLDAE